MAGAGYSADELVAAGVPVFSVGSSTFADALIHDGTSPSWSAAELAAAFKAAEVEPAALRFVGFSATELATGGYTLRILAGAGYSADELYAAGVPQVSAVGSFAQLLIDGYGAADLQTFGVGAADMRTVGFSISDLQGANYTEEQILNAGFSAPELAQAGLPSNGGGTFDDGYNEGFSEGQVAGFSNGQYGYGQPDYFYLETKLDGTDFGNGFFDGYLNGYNLGYSMAYQPWGGGGFGGGPDGPGGFGGGW